MRVAVSGKGKGTGSSIEKNTPRKKRGSVVVDDVAGAGRAEAEQEKGAQSDESTREQMVHPACGPVRCAMPSLVGSRCDAPG